jgi:shikimate kinase/3-dehydroquinate synthase
VAGSSAAGRSARCARAATRACRSSGRGGLSLNDVSATKVYLAGLSGAGKTTVAEHVAGWLGWPFFDIDREVERAAGCTIAAVWRAEGEVGFRRLEQAAVEHLVEHPGPVVAALGGGTLEDAASRERLAGWGSGVFLEAPVETLADRVGNSTERPLLGDGAPIDQLRALASARQPRYEALPHRVNANGRAPEVIAVDVVRALEWPSPKPIAESIWMGRNALAHASHVVDSTPATRNAAVVLVATDDRVWRLHGDALRLGLAGLGWEVVPHLLPAGEAAKSEAVLARLWNALRERGADRDTPLIVLGGGAAGDVSGLAAATFKRGLPLFLFPTTLLSQVDAAIGGKNAIDYAGVKNLVGAFYLPKAVCVDPLCLLTLPERDYRSGWAEVVKAGMIKDSELFTFCSQEAGSLARRELDAIESGLTAAIAVKTKIVDEDLYEAGPRRALNLGHTLGHALEMAGAGKWTHGEAVAIGIVAAARLGERLEVTEPGLADRAAASLEALGLPTRAADVDHDCVLDALRHDKKRADERLQVVLPVTPGEIRIQPIDDATVRAWVDETIG